MRKISSPGVAGRADGRGKGTRPRPAGPRPPFGALVTQLGARPEHISLSAPQAGRLAMVAVTPASLGDQCA